jgi:hypothetical protein
VLATFAGVLCEGAEGEITELEAGTEGILCGLSVSWPSTCQHPYDRASSRCTWCMPVPLLRSVATTTALQPQPWLAGHVLSQASGLVLPVPSLVLGDTVSLAGAPLSRRSAPTRLDLAYRGVHSP